MSPILTTRPLAVALAAILVAGGGAAHAATAADARDAAVPAPPAAPAMPDVKALVAQARELAKRARSDEATLLALDDVLTSLPPSMAFVANEFGNPREIVKNAPYTAEAVTETIQLLPDGNRIVRKSTALLARDGAGRTRQERKGDGRSGVYIYDPIEDRSVVLNENSRTATRLPRVPMPPEPPQPPGAGPGPEGGPRAGAGARDVEIQPGRVIVRRNGGGEAGGEQDVRVEVIRIGRGEQIEGVPPPPMPPLTLPLVPRGRGRDEEPRHARVRRRQGRRQADDAHDPGRRNRQREAHRRDQRALVLAGPARRRLREDERPARGRDDLPAHRREARRAPGRSLQGSGRLQDARRVAARLTARAAGRYSRVSPGRSGSRIGPAFSGRMATLPA